MKATTLAYLVSLAGMVASASIPQQRLMLGGITSNRASAALRDTQFGLKLLSTHDIAQCARTELRWENGMVSSPLTMSSHLKSMVTFVCSPHCCLH